MLIDPPLIVLNYNRHTFLMPLLERILEQSSSNNVYFRLLYPWQDEQKKKVAAVNWLSDEAQPYAPIELPFGASKDEKASLGSMLTTPSGDLKNPNELFVLQLPRVLPLTTKEEKGKKKEEASEGGYDLLKQIRGKVGKMRVYKSGKVEMEIEGVKYNVENGVQSKVRQEIAAVDKDCRNLFVLGETSKKMIVAPDIEFLLNNNK